LDSFPLISGLDRDKSHLFFQGREDERRERPEKGQGSIREITIDLQCALIVPNFVFRIRKVYHLQVSVNRYAKRLEYHN